MQSPPKKQKKPRGPKVPKKITDSYLHNSGLYYLERFASSSANFKTVMMRKVWKSCAHHQDQDKDECAAMVDKLVVKFIDLGLLDDAAYTRAVVTSLRRKGTSTRAILTKMKMKGVNRDDTMRALRHYDAENIRDPEQAELVSALTTARRKRLGPFQREDKKARIEDEEEAQKLKEKEMAKLARAGFSYDTVRRVFEINSDEADSFLYENG